MMQGAQEKLFHIFYQILSLSFELDFFLNFEFDFNIVEDYVGLSFIFELFFLSMYSLKVYLKGL